MTVPASGLSRWSAVMAAWRQAWSKATRASALVDIPLSLEFREDTVDE